MGKIRYLFKKLDTKEIFHAKIGTTKDRNVMDLTEAEDIKKRWQEYTEELHKKDLHDADDHDGVITNLEPDIPEYEVKWALGSITVNKAGGGDGIPVEPITNPKRGCYESVALNILANLESSAVATGLEKIIFHCTRKATPKNVQITT